MKQFTLSARERLKSRKQIEQLFSSGRFFNVPPLRVIYTIEAGESALQFGVAVSSRNFKKAVDRNRVKRLIREGWRLQKLPLQARLAEKGHALRVFVIYSARELPDQAFISEKIEVAIQKLVTIVHEADPSNS